MNSNQTVKERRILVVDDEESNLKLATSVLKWEKSHIIIAKNGAEALEKLKNTEFDVVLLDIQMPELNGFEVLKQIRKDNKNTSVIFLSSSKKVEDVVRGLNAGADDYICKPFHPTELLARVNAQLRHRDQSQELILTNQNLSKLVSVDDLTGLLNMKALYDRLEVEIERVKRFRRGIAVVMLDLDYFKLVNDKNDHLFGSFVLTQIGNMIKENMRQVDFAARYGGDEFIIILTDTNIVGAQVYCERLREKIESYKFVNGLFSARLTASFGFSIYDGTGPAMQGKDLVRNADRALYKSKNSGRNCVSYFSFDEDTNSKINKG